jgi:hypothetical protein
VTALVIATCAALPMLLALYVTLEEGGRAVLGCLLQIGLIVLVVLSTLWATGVWP